MPFCSVPGCNTSSKNGFRMVRFPKDPDKKEEWLTSLNCPGLRLNNCFICEAHFEPDMWEKTRPDGSRRLKTFAVPTLFPWSVKDDDDFDYSYLKLSEIDANSEEDFETIPSPNERNIEPFETVIIPPAIKNYSKKRFKRSKNLHTNNSHKNESDTEVALEREIVYIQESTETEIPIEEVYSEEEITETSIAEELLTTTNIRIMKQVNTLDNITNKTKSSQSIFNKEKKLTTYAKMVNANKQLNKNNREMAIKLRDLQREVAELQMKLDRQTSSNTNEPIDYKFVEQFFNQDQLAYMSGRKLKCWSKSTVEKALKLRSRCGISGYKELLSQNFPFPTLRTLHRIELRRNSSLASMVASSSGDTIDEEADPL